MVKKQLQARGAGSMKVNIVAKNIEVTPALRDIVEKKISKLDKYFGPSVEAKAILTVEKNRQIFEVTIIFNGVILRREESSDDMYKSIDIVVEKLQRQVRRQKTRLSRKNSGGSLRYPDFISENIAEEEGEAAKIVKTKNFGVKPMSQEEAMLQMELLGHSFFVYEDANSNSINVLYKRKDGNYGLIEPEY